VPAFSLVRVKSVPVPRNWGKAFNGSARRGIYSMRSDSKSSTWRSDSG